MKRSIRSVLSGITLRVRWGLPLAEEFAARGAEVVLVAGPVSRQTEHPAIRRINVESAAEMFEQVMNYAEDSHIIVSCAAVADFTPDRKAGLKLKKRGRRAGVEIEADL